MYRCIETKGAEKLYAYRAADHPRLCFRISRRGPLDLPHPIRMLCVMSIGCEPESRMLPTPRGFCRHILSERTTQAASNKRRLHLVSGGISL